MNETDKLAKTIWDYMQLHQQPVKSDIILALGSSDLRVAECAADLFLKGYGKWLVCSGGLGRLTKKLWQKPEAEKFAEVATTAGVPKENIIIENQSTRTGENIEFTRKLLEHKGLSPTSVLLVTKPYMERRAYGRFKKIWPEIDIRITSPQLSFDDYPTQELSKDFVINMMVGDLQRIKIYGEKNWEIKQKIPANVWRAYEELLRLGYDKQLIKK